MKKINIMLNVVLFAIPMIAGNLYGMDTNGNSNASNLGISLGPNDGAKILEKLNELNGEQSCDKVKKKVSKRRRKTGKKSLDCVSQGVLASDFDNEQPPVIENHQPAIMQEASITCEQHNGNSKVPEVLNKAPKRLKPPIMSWLYYAGVLVTGAWLSESFNQQSPLPSLMIAAGFGCFGKISFRHGVYIDNEQERLNRKARAQNPNASKPIVPRIESAWYKSLGFGFSSIAAGFALSGLKQVPGVGSSVQMAINTTNHFSRTGASHVSYLGSVGYKKITAATKSAASETISGLD